MTGSKLGTTYLLVSNPELSGPPPQRRPPPIAVSTPTKSATNLPKTHSPLYSTPSQQFSVEDEIDDFEDEDEDEDSIAECVSRHRFNDITDLVLELPSFQSGLSSDDLRETAYEVLLASVGAAG